MFINIASKDSFVTLFLILHNNIGLAWTIYIGYLSYKQFKYVKEILPLLISTDITLNEHYSQLARIVLNQGQEPLEVMII